LRFCNHLTSRFLRLHISSNQLSLPVRVDQLDSGFRFHIPRTIS